MPSSILSASITVTVMTAAMLASYALWEIRSPRRKNVRLRQKLPKDLATWRHPSDAVAEHEQIWIDLDEVFLNAGFSLWRMNRLGSAVVAPPGYPFANGFGYAAGHRTDLEGLGSPRDLRVFHIMNPSSRAARTRDGHDVGIRVITINNEGHDHLRILRKVATGLNSLFSNNHVLPMLSEFQFEDIIFGIFPKVGAELRDLYGNWARNSAGDVVEVMMQMLEALAFIHKLNIAHRDAFKDNFLIQWHPESLKTMTISPSRPRVFLIDFEVAIDFPPECPVEEQVVTGIPTGGSFGDSDRYTRPHAPEYISGKPYSPFKLDIWQMASSLTDVRSTIPGIDKVLDDMYCTNPDERPHAQEALDRIRSVVNSMSPQSLLIAPWMKNDFLAEMEAEELQLQESNKD
ncbi:kinase-like domain-containing protein [Pholiota molesta]|nr:kinase-like domain-containing protein [Pholiota molesta]